MDKLSSISPRFNALRVSLASSRFLEPLAIVGGLYLGSRLFSVSSWIWLHLLRRGNVQKYKSKDGDTWAVVTGASAGIGKGFVQELASNGFNVILHGRNEGKLSKFQDELQSQYPKLKFRLLVLDADEFEISTMESAVSEIKGLNIRILVNNVAGGGKHEKPVLETFQHKTPENIDSWTNITTRFPTHITRCLLPTLIAKDSSLILNVCSGISEMAVPYMAVYSGLKSYNKAWSRSLQRELQADNNTHVEVTALMVGETATERANRDAGMMCPSARQLAKSSLQTVGCGEDVITPYYGHALQDAITGLLPKMFFDHFILGIARQMKADERAGKAFQ